MTFKTFKEFIEEDFNSTFPGKGIIDRDIDDETEINYYYEKLKTIDLRKYMTTFTGNRANKDAINNFLTNSNYGTPDFLRFFLVYYNNAFTIYVFNGYISHLSFADLLDTPANKPKWINTKSFSELYSNVNIVDTKEEEEEKNKLEELKTIWCLPGTYDKGKIETNASPFYMNLLAKLGVHVKLGFDIDTWNSIHIKEQI
jgi:hypothetical protein